MILKKTELIKTDGHLPESPNEIRDKYLFVNNIEKANELKLLEYEIWYDGDGDELLNFYRGNNAIRYNYEPFFDENKRSYFWCVSSTENDFKRTHSGLPREIVDTLTNIIGTPILTCEGKQEVLDKINKENNFNSMLKKIIIPMTLVLGWGCVKIDWDLGCSSTPIFQFYRAKDVDFVYKYKTRLTGAIFKDYYVRNGDEYLLVESRDISEKPGKLVIRKYMYHMDRDDNLNSMTNLEVKKVFPEIKMDTIIIDNYNELLVEPFVFFNDSTFLGYGRSIFTGKIDLFDDLDQTLSLASISVRRSSTKVYFNSEFLERDENGLPIAPKEFDCKYVMYKGARNADGSSANVDPVEVVQPKIDFEQYQLQASDLVLHILQGIMSPATLGIDISKRDNADAQREKEKITIFTREAILQHLAPAICHLFKQALNLQSYLNDQLKGLDNLDYEVKAKFETFADASFENKITILGNAFSMSCISPELFVEKLYGDTLSEEEKQREIEYLHTQKVNEDRNEYNEQEELLAELQ